VIMIFSFIVFVNQDEQFKYLTSCIVDTRSRRIHVYISQESRLLINHYISNHTKEYKNSQK
jgi:hypothetical protein